MTAPPPQPAAYPEVDLRTVVLTWQGDRLLVALVDRQPDARSSWARGLPRGRPEQASELDGTAGSIARQATGLTERYLEQLYTMSVDRSSRGSWKVVVAWMALVAPGPDGAPPLAPGAAWAVAEDLPEISRIDRRVTDYALVRLRAKLGYTDVGRHLLPDTFTLRELQSAYEAILGRPLDKRNFRRRMLAADLLAPTDGTRRDGSHRPAALYAFRPGGDPTSYLTPSWSDRT